MSTDHRVHLGRRQTVGPGTDYGGSARSLRLILKENEQWCKEFSDLMRCALEKDDSGSWESLGDRSSLWWEHEKSQGTHVWSAKAPGHIIGSGWRKDGGCYWAKEDRLSGTWGWSGDEACEMAHRFLKWNHIGWPFSNVGTHREETAGGERQWTWALVPWHVQW